MFTEGERGRARSPVADATGVDHDGRMITALGNLAVKVTDLDSAIAFYERTGAVVRHRLRWGTGERADVHLGPLQITLFTKAIYEDTVDVAPEGFLHAALFTDNLDRELDGHDVLWGPAVVEGPFGRRRIAFVAAPGGVRLEFMEQLAPPGPEAEDAERGAPD